jgi:hypothetical protein
MSPRQPLGLFINPQFYYAEMKADAGWSLPLAYSIFADIPPADEI